MFSFLLGWVASKILLANRYRVVYALAVLLIGGRRMAFKAARQAIRASAQLVDDVEDIVAEARAAQAGHE